MKKTTIAIGLFAALSALQCNPDPFRDFNPYDTELGSRIDAYHDTKYPESMIQKDKQSMYIDFSTGIQIAFNTPQNKELLTKVFNTLLGTELQVFKLGSKNIDPMPNITGQIIYKSEEYKDKYAPITKAVKDIIIQNREAFLITDFEEYDLTTAKAEEITKKAYLIDDFKKWLKNGNSIRFYVSDYIENKTTKHLYYAVFYTSNSDILPKVSNALAVLPHFDLTNKGYQLSQGYETTTSGGIFYDATAGTDVAKNVLELDKKKYINGFTEHKNYEFYPLLPDWEYIEKTKNELQFKDFFRKLFIDLSNTDSYNISDLDVKVYDITNDFELFAKCLKVAEQKPIVTKNKNGENLLSADENDDITLACYDDKGKIKKEWIYKPIITPSIPDLFTLNKKLFTNSKNSSNNKKAEIAVSFDSKFNIKNIDNPNGLLRVDIVIKSAQANSATKSNLFKWNSTISSTENIALYESIQNTLADPKINPTNTVIYTYYIKTNAKN